MRTLAVAFLLGFAPSPALGDEADDEEGLRQRLTEREDKRRPVVPFTIELAGKPLVLGGELELEFLELERWIVDAV